MASHSISARRTRRARLVCVFAGALALSMIASATHAPSRVAAQDGVGNIRDSTPQDRPQMLSFFTGLQYNANFTTYGFPFLLAGRYYFPIVKNGFIPSLNDEFGLEGGLNLLFLFGDTTYVGFGLPFEAVWDFHISTTFDAYAKAGFLVGSTFGYDGFWWDFRTSVGLRLKLTPAMYFRAEVGYPSVMAGLGFAF
ncbi:MAG: hypothetical protein ABW321_34405 [Polyangiales bacterium]